MKKLLLLLPFLLLGCEKEIEEPKKNNVVFYSNGWEYKITGDVNGIVRPCEFKEPDCTYPEYDLGGDGYLVMYLEPGKYEVYIVNTHNPIYQGSRKFTVHEGICNIFDCGRSNGWN